RSAEASRLRRTSNGRSVYGRTALGRTSRIATRTDPLVRVTAAMVMRRLRIACRSGECAHASPRSELVYYALRCLIQDCFTCGSLAAISDLLVGFWPEAAVRCGSILV